MNSCTDRKHCVQFVLCSLISLQLRILSSVTLHVSSYCPCSSPFTTCVPLLYHLNVWTTLRWQHCCTLRNSFLFLNLLLLFIILAALVLVSLKDVLTLTSVSVPTELLNVNMADTSRRCDITALTWAVCLLRNASKLLHSWPTAQQLATELFLNLSLHFVDPKVHYRIHNSCRFSISWRTWIQSKPSHHLVYDPFYHSPSIFFHVFQEISSLQVSPPKSCLHLSTPIRATCPPFSSSFTLSHIYLFTGYFTLPSALEAG